MPIFRGYLPTPKIEKKNFFFLKNTNDNSKNYTYLILAEFDENWKIYDKTLLGRMISPRPSSIRVKNGICDRYA